MQEVPAPRICSRPKAPTSPAAFCYFDKRRSALVAGLAEHGSNAHLGENRGRTIGETIIMVRNLGVVVTVVFAMMLTACTGSTTTPPVTSTTAALATTSASVASLTTWWADSTWISPLVGWVLGEGTAGCSACLVIKNTINGGRSWSAVPAPRGGLSDPTSQACVRLGGCVAHLLFVNRHDGYLYGPGLFTTTDGGRTWRRQAGKQTEALATVAPGVVWRLAYDHDGCPGPCDVILQQQRAGSTRWTTVRAPFDDTLTGVTPQIVSIGAARILIVFYGNLASGFPEQCQLLHRGRSRAVLDDPDRPLRLHRQQGEQRPGNECHGAGHRRCRVFSQGRLERSVHRGIARWWSDLWATPSDFLE